MMTIPIIGHSYNLDSIVFCTRKDDDTPHTQDDATVYLQVNKLEEARDLLATIRKTYPKWYRKAFKKDIGPTSCCVLRKIYRQYISDKKAIEVLYEKANKLKKIQRLLEENIQDKLSKPIPLSKELRDIFIEAVYLPEALHHHNIFSKESIEPNSFDQIRFKVDATPNWKISNTLRLLLTHFPCESYYSDKGDLEFRVVDRKRKNMIYCQTLRQLFALYFKDNSVKKR